MGDSCCSGTVDIRAMEARERRVLMIVLAINIATFVMMLSAAIYSGSSSLLSGSLDNLGDALTYLLSIAVIGASTRAKAKVALLKGLLRSEEQTSELQSLMRISFAVFCLKKKKNK